MLNEQLNAAVTEVIQGTSENDYLNQIIHGNVDTVQDFANYVSENFWANIHDTALEPVGDVDTIIKNLKSINRGKMTLRQVQKDIVDWNVGDEWMIDVFADCLKVETAHLVVAVDFMRLVESIGEKNKLSIQAAVATVVASVKVPEDAVTVLMH